MGGKNFGFPWKILQPANLKKGGQKVCKKEGAKKILIPPTFCKNLISKNQEYSPARQCSFLTPPPHPPPTSFLASYLCELGFFGVELELSRCGYQHGPRAECADKPCILS
jgi:hypothetical protein